MEVETCFFKHFIAGVVLELTQQLLIQLPFILGDDFGIIGLAAQRVVIVESMRSPVEGNAVSARP